MSYEPPENPWIAARALQGQLYRARKKARWRWQRRQEWRKAHKAVERALRSGRLQRQSCQVQLPGCQEWPVEAHHYAGYEPEHWLDIVWVCEPCHRELTRRAWKRSQERAARAQLRADAARVAGAGVIIVKKSDGSVT